MVGTLLQREHCVSLVRETPQLSRARLPWWHACIVVDLFCLSLSQCESAGHFVKQQSWMSHCTRDTVWLPNSIRADGTDSPSQCWLSNFLKWINRYSQYYSIYWRCEGWCMYINMLQSRSRRKQSQVWQALPWMIQMSAVSSIRCSSL